MSERIQKYRELCQHETTIPLFCRDWWLDAVAPGQWDVALSLKDGKVVASMPYVVERRAGMKVLTMPALTQHLGPWFKPSQAKYSKRLANEKDMLTDLAGQLLAQRYDHFYAAWPTGRGNWLPFYWAGFQQTTRYTYILQDLSNLDEIWEELQSNIRSDIRKAEGRFKLRVRADLGVDDFLALNRLVFQRQGMKLPYSEAMVKRLDAICSEKGCRTILIAEDGAGRQHAGVYIVWDEHSAYYIMGGGDPELRSSGATSLCMWEAIKIASGVTRRFDFEGSMIEPVERFVRGFGATQTPYFAIRKTSSRLLKSFFFFQDIFRKNK